MNVDTEYFSLSGLFKNHNTDVFQKKNTYVNKNKAWTMAWTIKTKET